MLTHDFFIIEWIVKSLKMKKTHIDDLNDIKAMRVATLIKHKYFLNGIED